MRIAMPCENLSLNTYLRAYPFAKFLSENHDVTVLGPMTKTGLFPPIKHDTTIRYHPTPQRYIFPFYLKNSIDVYRQLDADIVHAFKVTAHSFLPALIKKLRDKNQRVVLDIDDWESQYIYDYYFSSNPLDIAKFLFVDLYTPESYFLKKALEKQVRRADAVITSSRTLQRMFGGTWIPTGPDTEYFDPEKFTGKNVRDEFGLKDKTVVLFMGTPRKHKGVEDLMHAVHEARKINPAIHLLIVGADPGNPYTKTLRMNEGVTIEGYRSHEEMPAFLAAADIVCVPLRTTPSANAQLPIKVFEPMAMARPVIATDTTDMREILSECGLITDPQSPTALANAILAYANDKDLRRKHGARARGECVKKYSWKVMKQKTLTVYEGL